MSLRSHIHLPNFYVGGTEQWALSLIKGMPDVEWSVSVPDGALSHPLGLKQFEGVRKVSMSAISDDVDVVLVCAETSAPVRGARTVMVAHGTAPYYKGIVKNARCTEAVAVSRFAREAFAEGWPVTVIYNGVDLARLRCSLDKWAVRRRLGLSEDAVVGYIGRFTETKNPLAAGLVASRIKGGVALYVGPGPNADEWMRRAREISACVYVPAADVGCIGDIYSTCDVCVFASVSEGFCLATVEAWYHRVPVVATPVGIAAEEPDLVFAVPVAPAVNALAAAAQRALASDEAMRSQGREIVLRKYSSDRMVREWRDYLFSGKGGVEWSRRSAL